MEEDNAAGCPPSWPANVNAYSMTDLLLQLKTSSFSVKMGRQPGIDSLFHLEHLPMKPAMTVKYQSG